MSKPATKEVEYMSEGQLIKATVDKKTAADIGQYKSIYNCVQSFEVGLVDNTPSKYKDQGFLREILVAESPRLKIVCIKDFYPNVSELYISPRYECGIVNKKTNDFKRVTSGVDSLYYKLFRDRVK